MGTAKKTVKKETGMERADREYQAVRLCRLRLEARGLCSAVDYVRGVKAGTTNEAIQEAFGWPCELMPEVRDLITIKRLLRQNLSEQAFEAALDNPTEAKDRHLAEFLSH